MIGYVSFSADDAPKERDAAEEEIELVGVAKEAETKALDAEDDFINENRVAIEDVSRAMNKATGSCYYVISQCAILEEGFTCRNVLHVALSIFAIFLQFVALKAALCTIDILAYTNQYDDYYPSINDDTEPVSTNQIFLLLTKIGANQTIPTNTLFTILFVVVSIGASIVEEIKEVIGGWCLLAVNTTLERRKIVEWRSWEMFSLLVRASFCMLMQYMRIGLIMEFYEATIFVIGTSDGQFNIVLNSLALSFILNFDEALTSYRNDVFSISALPTDRDESSTSYLHDCACQRFSEFVVGEKNVFALEKALRIINRVIFPYITIGMSIGVVLIQAYTCGGVEIAADDGNVRVPWNKLKPYKKFLLPSLFMLGVTLSFPIRFLVHEAIFPQGSMGTAKHAIEGLFDAFIVWILFALISETIILQLLQRWQVQQDFGLTDFSWPLLPFGTDPL